MLPDGLFYFTKREVIHLKIKKVDDKPMVIHTKQKAKPFWGDMPYAKYYENENFPKGLYKEHTLSNIINTIIGAGFNICRFDEYPFHDEKIPCKFIIKAKKIMSDSR